MIFCFSGTGNSRHVALEISRYLNDKLISIPDEINNKDGLISYNMDDESYLGFVYPVHAWGPPKIVLDFIDRLEIKGSPPYVFSVSTCGEEEGKTTQILKNYLEKKSLNLSSAFTIVMPNNYILSYDIEPDEDINKLLVASEEKIKEICQIIENKETNIYDLIPGSLSFPKSKIVNTFFKKYALDNKKFFADDKCNSCGLCEDICPVHSIKVNGKPTWQGDCTMCLACINRCPTQAIQYGKKTTSRGRYFHPDLK